MSLDERLDEVGDELLVAVEASAQPDDEAGTDLPSTTRTTRSARRSPQLLAKYLQNGRVIRARRGIYRLVHFPPGEHEELTTVWLWSDREGVFSHETALSLHGLSDVLPARIHLTLPAELLPAELRSYEIAKLTS